MSIKLIFWSSFKFSLKLITIQDEDFTPCFENSQNESQLKTNIQLFYCFEVALS